MKNTTASSIKALKDEYLKGDVLSVNSFLILKGIKKDGNVSRITKGWRLQREGYQQALAEAKERATIKAEADAVARQVRIARSLQLKGLKALEKQEPQTAYQAMRMLIVGQREERAALGLDSDNTQVQNEYDPALLGTRFMQNLIKQGPQT